MRSSSGFGLRALEVFCAVCETRSMTDAAKRLGMTQPAVSQAVKQLETAVGVALIDRKRRPLTPTTSGRWLTHAAAQILHDTEQIPIALRNLERSQKLHLRIGLVDSLSYPFAAIMVRRLEASVRYLSISSGLAQTLRVGLLEHNLDLVITNDSMEDVDGVIRRQLLSEPYILVVPSKIADSGVACDLRTLGLQLPLIRWASHSQIGAHVDQHLRRMRLDIPRRYEFESASSILDIISSGLGWALMTPLSIFDIKAVLNRIRILPMPAPVLSRRLELVSRAGEIDLLAERILRLSKRILRERYVPEALQVAPWLKDQIVV